MFPLRERSSVNPGAPALDDASIEEFRSRPEPREKLRLSLVRMLRFYGFGIQHGPFGIANAPKLQRTIYELAVAPESQPSANHPDSEMPGLARPLEPETPAPFERLAFIYRL